MGKPLVTVGRKKNQQQSQGRGWWPSAVVKEKGGQKYNKQDETQGDSICARL